VLGAMVITPERASYVPAAGEPELYVNLLVTSRRQRGRGVGAALIGQALAEAAERGLDLIRVDCFAGDDGKLVRYYESVGFTPVQEFTVGEWPGQLLELRLSASG
jgi:GNAT superfamily N-acetyltransferase